MINEEVIYYLGQTMVQYEKAIAMSYRMMVVIGFTGIVLGILIGLYLKVRIVNCKRYNL